MVNSQLVVVRLSHSCYLHVAFLPTIPQLELHFVLLRFSQLMLDY